MAAHNGMRTCYWSKPMSTLIEPPAQATGDLGIVQPEYKENGRIFARLMIAGTQVGIVVVASGDARGVTITCISSLMNVDIAMSWHVDVVGSSGCEGTQVMDLWRSVEKDSVAPSSRARRTSYS